MDTNVVNTTALSAAWTSVVTFAPKFLAFLFILIVGYFVAKALGGLIAKALNKAKFDDRLNRSNIGDALGRAGFRGSELVGRISYYGLMLLVLQLAFSVFGPNAVSDLLTRTIAYLPNLIVALVIAVISFTVAGAVRDIVMAAIGGLGYGRILANLAAGTILVIGIFAALTQLNVATPIVLGLYYAMLAVIVGSAIVAIGGGGIVPMRSQWEKALTRASEEAPKLRMEVERAQRDNGASHPIPEQRIQPTEAGVRAAQQPESFDEYGRRAA